MGRSPNLKQVRILPSSNGNSETIKKIPGRNQVPKYIQSSTFLFHSRHCLGSLGTMNRVARIYQLNNKQKRSIFAGEVSYPISKLPPELNAKKFEDYLLQAEKDVPSKIQELLNKQAEKIKESKDLRNSFALLNLSQYEYENQLLEQKNARRGLNPRKIVDVPSRHVRYEIPRFVKIVLPKGFDK